MGARSASVRAEPSAGPGRTDWSKLAAWCLALLFCAVIWAAAGLALAAAL